MSAAQLILDLLLGVGDVPVLCQAMLHRGLHSLLVGWASADPDSITLPESSREASLRISLVLAKQPSLHSELLASGICKVLVVALKGFFTCVSAVVIFQILLEALRHLCLHGELPPPQPCWHFMHRNQWLLLWLKKHLEPLSTALLSFYKVP